MTAPATATTWRAMNGCALGGAPAGRLGLALLQRRGVVPGTRAWPSTAPAPAARPAPGAAPVAEEIVGVLATMALACLAA
jgi:hypothetical protein